MAYQSSDADVSVLLRDHAGRRNPEAALSLISGYVIEPGAISPLAMTGQLSYTLSTRFQEYAYYGFMGPGAYLLHRSKCRHRC